MNIKLAKELMLSLGITGDITGEGDPVEKVIEDLDIMARYKYDHYEMFVPGARFFEHLYLWLKQFRTVEQRRNAVAFIRQHLIFISQREMQDLARCVYYEAIVPEIIQKIIQEKHLGQFEYAVAYTKFFPEYLRRCLFIGLSDGAQINFFRRHHIELSQEQVLPYYRTESEEYLKKLREETGDEKAIFWGVFLIDDFTGSGYTLIHQDKDPETGNPKLLGALQRVYDIHQDIIKDASRVCVCHYISTAYTQSYIKRYLKRIEKEMPEYKNKLKTYAALTIPQEVRVFPLDHNRGLLKDIAAMCEEYYDKSFETSNTKKLGGIKFGFGKLGLPLVLHSNTPNNTIFLLWVDTGEKQTSPSFHSLFRRIDRHRPKHD